MLDTSAINRLLDDPQSGPITMALADQYTVWISTVAVGEVGSTQLRERREQLLSLMWQLTQDRRPVEEPTLLIRRALGAYAAGQPDFLYSIGEENDAAWQILQDPAFVDSQSSLTLLADQRERSRAFMDMHRAARPELRSLAPVLGTDYPKSAAGLIKIYLTSSDFLMEVAATFFARTAGRNLIAGEAAALFGAVPELTGYLLGWAHSIFDRAIGTQSLGGNSAGDRDLAFATYLGRLGFFITADERQYRALRLIGRCFAPSCLIIRYRSLARHLALSPPR